MKADPGVWDKNLPKQSIVKRVAWPASKGTGKTGQNPVKAAIPVCPGDL